MKLPCTIHGFAIAAGTCATVQGVRVSHPSAPATRLDFRPTGWYRSARDAVEEIERQYQHAHAPEHGFALSTYHVNYIQRLARWWPDAPNPPKALAERAKQDAENALAEQKRLVEIDTKIRLAEAAPDLLAAAKRVLVQLEGGNLMTSAAAAALLRAAITKAEKG